MRGGGIHLESRSNVLCIQNEFFVSPQIKRVDIQTLSPGRLSLLCTRPHPTCSTETNITKEKKKKKTCIRGHRTDSPVSHCGRLVAARRLDERGRMPAGRLDRLFDSIHPSIHPSAYLLLFLPLLLHTSVFLLRLLPIHLHLVRLQLVSPF